MMHFRFRARPGNATVPHDRVGRISAQPKWGRYEFAQRCIEAVRKSGTGCITMINDHLYEGRFTPRVNGKRISKNVYAKTREECEEKLGELIKTMKAEIAEMKKAANA
ncbi:MAG: hypothetical protein II330_00935 [Clostridia bacterium]|nr:hypothetical protein [Clostridia bacterium]